VHCANTSQYHRCCRYDLRVGLYRQSEQIFSRCSSLTNSPWVAMPFLTFISFNVLMYVFMIVFYDLYSLRECYHCTTKAPSQMRPWSQWVLLGKLRLNKIKYSKVDKYQLLNLTSSTVGSVHLVGQHCEGGW